MRGLESNIRTKTTNGWTDTNFTNWANDAVRDGTDQSVQISLFGKTNGKLTDESCKKTYILPEETGIKFECTC